MCVLIRFFRARQFRLLAWRARVFCVFVVLVCHLVVAKLLPGCCETRLRGHARFLRLYLLNCPHNEMEPKQNEQLVTAGALCFDRNETVLKLLFFSFRVVTAFRKKCRTLGRNLVKGRRTSLLYFWVVFKFQSYPQPLTINTIVLGLCSCLHAAVAASTCPQ